MRRDHLTSEGSNEERVIARFGRVSLEAVGVSVSRQNDLESADESIRYFHTKFLSPFASE